SAPWPRSSERPATSGSPTAPGAILERLEMAEERDGPLSAFRRARVSVPVKGTAAMLVSDNDHLSVKDDGVRVDCPADSPGTAPRRDFNRAGDRPPARAGRSRAWSGTPPGRRRGRLRPGRAGGCPPALPQIRTCPIKASGSSCHAFATGRHTEWTAIAGGSG